MKFSPGKETVKLSANEKSDEGVAIHVYFCDSHEIAAISSRERFRFSYRLGISWEWRGEAPRVGAGNVLSPGSQTR